MRKRSTNLEHDAGKPLKRLPIFEAAQHTPMNGGVNERRSRGRAPGWQPIREICGLNGFLWAGFALLWLLFAGCATQEKPNYLAAVEIQGNTPGQIATVTEAVFTENGYKLTGSSPGKFVFEKPGSGMNKFAYGDWVGDTEVWVRAKLNIVPIGEALFRIECTADLVKDKGRSTEEQIKISSMHHRPYQKLLDDAAARLKPKVVKP